MIISATSNSAKEFTVEPRGGEGELLIRERVPFVFLGVKNYLAFLTFPYPEPFPIKLCDFIGCFESHKQQKRYCISKYKAKSKLYTV